MPGRSSRCRSRLWVRLTGLAWPPANKLPPLLTTRRHWFLAILLELLSSLTEGANDQAVLRVSALGWAVSRELRFPAIGRADQATIA
jgi:hypothetical protein